MKRLVLEKEAIKKNISRVKDKAGKAAVYAVLTGDAYGAGLVEMAGILREEGIARFAVSEPEEAARLRKAGFVDEEILMLRSTTDREELEQLMDLNVICSIGSYDAGTALNGIAEGRATIVEAHIQVDAGSSFGGFLPEEPDKILSMYRYLPNVALSGVYTRLGDQEGGKKEVEGQVERLHQLLDAIHEAGFETGTVHASGPYALVNHEFAGLDAVQVGSALLGRGRREVRGLTEVGYGEAAIEEIRWLPKGYVLSERKKRGLKKAARVAILPVGYQDGFRVGRLDGSGLWRTIFRWWLDRTVWVRVGTQKARILGNVGPYETLLDVTDLKCGAGDVAVFEMDPLYAKGLKKEYR